MSNIAENMYSDIIGRKNLPLYVFKMDYSYNFAERDILAKVHLLFLRIFTLQLVHVCVCAKVHLLFFENFHTTIGTCVRVCTRKLVRVCKYDYVHALIINIHNRVHSQRS